MAHLVCRCGYDMWNGESPNDIEFWVYSDKTMDEISMEDNIPFLTLQSKHDYNVWRCPKCGRLYVFSENGGTVPEHIYRLEE
jgi:hypothetical protein